jgi:hypothetical protein
LAACQETLTAPATVPEATCSATPQAIARLDRRSAGFVLDDQSAYLSMEGIWRVAKVGGPLERLSPEGPTGLLVRAGTELYWTERAFQETTARVLARSSQTKAEVRLLASDVMAPAHLESTPFRIGGLAVTAEYVCVLLAGAGHQLVWLERSTGRMAGARGNGGPGQYSLVGDEQGVFFGETALISAVAPRGGTAAREAAPRGFALDSTHLYWRDQAGALGYKLVRAPRADLRTVEVLGDISAEESFAMAVDDAFVYWTDQRGAVERLPKNKTGSRPALVASAGAFDDDDYQAALAVDEHAVYWYAGAPGARASDDEPLWLMRACKTAAP